MVRLWPMLLKKKILLYKREQSCTNHLCPFSLMTSHLLFLLPFASKYTVNRGKIGHNTFNNKDFNILLKAKKNAATLFLMTRHLLIYIHPMITSCNCINLHSPIPFPSCWVCIELYYQIGWGQHWQAESPATEHNRTFQSFWGGGQMLREFTWVVFHFIYFYRFLPFSRIWQGRGMGDLDSKWESVLKNMLKCTTV